MRTRKAESPKPTPLMPCRAWKSVDRFLAKNGVRFLLALILFLVAGVGCHAIFMLQFVGCSPAPMFFAGLGSDSTSQMLSAKSLLEWSLMNGDLFWSWSYGLGGDLFSEFSYYYTTSPFFYAEFAIKALFGAAGAGIYVQQQWALIFSMVKQVVIMAAMYLLCRVEKKETAFSMIAGMVYGCAWWYLYYSYFYGGFMTDAMFWLPLAAIAFHFYLEKGKWIPLVCIIALTVANSFYFGYMSCLFYAVFFLIFSADKGIKIRGYFLRVSKLAGIAVMGLLLSCVFFLPSVNALLSADRTQTLFDSRLISSPSFFVTLPERLFTRAGRFVFPSFLVFAALLRFRECGSLCRKKTALALFWLVAWSVPMVSSVMNGFSYATDRWVYLVVFAVAYAVPDWLEALREQKPVGNKALFLGCSAIVVLYYTRIVRGVGFHELTDRLVMILSVAMLVIAYILQGCQLRLPSLSRIVCRCGKVALIGCMALCYILSSITSYALDNYLGLYSLDESTTQSFLVGDETQRTVNAELMPSRDEFYRVDDASIYQEERRYDNRSWLHRNYSISSYSSMINRELHQWIRRTYDVASRIDSPSYYRGFGHRLFLENAWGVEYKINQETLPYGYEYETLQSGNVVMHNTNGVGFDLWYDTTLSEDKFNDMDYAQRDAVLLQAAVVGEKAERRYPPAQLDQTTTVYPLDLSNGNFSNCRWEDGKLIVEDDAQILLPLPAVSGPGEFLLSFRIRELGDSRYSMNIQGSRVLCYESSYTWTFKTEEFSHAIPGNAERIEMSFTPGTYAIEELRLAFNSYDRLEDWTQARNRYNLENLIVSGSHVEGTLRNETPGILTLSMPYNKGWTCTVDGEKTPLIRVNGIFTGIEMEPGEHVIKMRFIPPYLIIGACITGATALALILFALRRPFAKRFGKNSREAENSGDMPRDNS